MIRNTDDSAMMNFGRHDRFDFPPGIIRVTSGKGGEATLVLGSEKTALHDCGMAYCGSNTVSNIKEALSGRTLDYILISHTHYDHIGALPQIMKAFPDATVCGSEYAKYVFTRPGAKKVIKEFGEAAKRDYDPLGGDEITADGMSIERVLRDGDELSLGEETIRVLETKGHTDCCLTYIVEPLGLMLASESTGVCKGPGISETAILKSYDDAMLSLKKCREAKPKYLILPHYGMLPPSENENYWQWFQDAAEEEKEFSVYLWSLNISMDEMLEKAINEFYTPERQKNQPVEAFVANAKAVLKVYEKYKEGEK